FLKYNQKEVDELKAKRIAKIQDPLALMNVENQVAQNPRVQNVGNQNGLIGVQGNGNFVDARAEGNAAGQNAHQIRKRQESNSKLKNMI
nr:hypothetical protein [Tanacetum cinerariifolium]